MSQLSNRPKTTKTSGTIVVQVEINNFKSLYDLQR